MTITASSPVSHCSDAPSPQQSSFGVATRNDALSYDDRSESPRGLGGGLRKPRSVFAPKWRAGNGVTASQPALFGYDDADRLATETDARGRVKTYSYEQARGLLLEISYSDDTPTESFVYNHLGQLTQVTDDAGVRSIGYNAYGEQETDSLLAGGKTHLVTETRDSFGRSTGYTYAKNGATQQTVSTAYGTDGRISSAGFLHGRQEKLFTMDTCRVRTCCRRSPSPTA